MQKVRFAGRVVTAALASALVAQAAFAAGPDYTTITAGIDWASVITGILAVAGLLVGLYGAVKGARILIGMVRGS